MSGVILSVLTYAFMECTVTNVPFWKNEIKDKVMGGACNMRGDL